MFADGDILRHDLIMLTNSDTFSKEALNRLRTEAFQKRITQQQIANAIGLNRSTVSTHLNGEDMSIAEFFNIADFIGTDPIQMLSQARQQQKVQGYEKHENAEAD